MDKKKKFGNKGGNISATDIAKEVSKQLDVLKSEAIGIDQDQEAMEEFIRSVVDKRKHDPSETPSHKKVRIHETVNEQRCFPTGASAAAFSSLLGRVKNHNKKK